MTRQVRRKRVGVDFHVVDGKFQGSRTHVIELFGEIIRQSPAVDFYLFLGEPGRLPELNPAFALPNVRAVKLPPSGPVKRLGLHLPRLQRRLGLDLLHLQYVLPLPSLCPCVVTIHDVLFESHPEYFDPAFVLRCKILVRQAARRSLHVFTVSEFCKGAIIERYAIPPERVSVIRNGVERARFRGGEEGTGAVRARGLAPHDYLLTVGRLEPRKNHLTLVRAYARLGEGAPPLVILGQRDFSYEACFDAIRDLGLGERVRIIEDVSDAELPAFYRHALVFVYPSYAEGFGIPALEALASGTPVISSNATAIPEVVGDAGLLVEAGDERALAEAMRRVLGDAGLRERLIERGIERARQFEWRDSAAIVSERYRALLGD